MVLTATVGFAQARPSFDQIAPGTGKFANGTAAAPSITFGSDPDTGIYRYGANEIMMATNGKPSLYVSPVCFGFYRDSNSAGMILNLGGTDGAGNIIPYAQIKTVIASNTPGAYAGNLTFHTPTSVAQTERMRITNLGNVLIGTTTDDGVNKLQVNGGVSILTTSGLIGGVVPISDDGMTTDEVLTTNIKIANYVSCGRLYLVSTSHNIKAIVDVFGSTLTLVTGSTTTEVSTTKDTASKLNIYVESGVLKIQNKRASTTSVYAQYTGIHDN